MSRGTSSLTVRSGPTLVATVVSFLMSSAQARQRARSEAKAAVSHARRGEGGLSTAAANGAAPRAWGGRRAAKRRGRTDANERVAVPERIAQQPNVLLRSGRAMEREEA